MIESAEIATVIASGGGTGLVGSVFSFLADYFRSKLVQDHEIKLRELDIEELQIEATLQGKTEPNEWDMKALEEDSDLMKTSYAQDMPKWTTKKARDSKAFLFLDFVRGFTRPAITFYLAIVVTAMFYLLMTMLERLESIGGVLVVTLLSELITAIVLMTLYVMSTVILWWFGSRSKVVFKKLGM